MKRLLQDRYMPVTNQVGFLQAPLDDLAVTIRDWKIGLDPTTVCDRFEATLEKSLLQLVPLNNDRILLVETQSDWTAVFRKDSDPLVSYISEIFPCRGVVANCREDTYDRKTRQGVPGSTHFSTYGGPNAGPSNYERNLISSNQCGKWVFVNYGDPLPFEQPEHYKARRVRDRFTWEMLEEYCLALGIRLFDEDFYGSRCAVVHTTQTMPPGFVNQTYEMYRKEGGF